METRNRVEWRGVYWVSSPINGFKYSILLPTHHSLFFCITFSKYMVSINRTIVTYEWTEASMIRLYWRNTFCWTRWYSWMKLSVNCLHIFLAENQKTKMTRYTIKQLGYVTKTYLNYDVYQARNVRIYRRLFCFYKNRTYTYLLAKFSVWHLLLFVAHAIILTIDGLIVINAQMIHDE